jgi:hypothetical protein
MIIFRLLKEGYGAGSKIRTRTNNYRSGSWKHKSGTLAETNWESGIISLMECGGNSSYRSWLSTSSFSKGRSWGMRDSRPCSVAISHSEIRPLSNSCTLGQSTACDHHNNVQSRDQQAVLRICDILVRIGIRDPCL